MSGSERASPSSAAGICEAVRSFRAEQQLHSAPRVRAQRKMERMTTGATERLPILDEDAIVELERGLPGGDLGPALQAFYEELQKRDVVLEELIASADLDEMASLAHGLKGSASTFCAPGLASAALTVEQKLAARDANSIRTAALGLSAELKCVVRHLRDFLERRRKART